MTDALTTIVTAALAHQRPVVVNWQTSFNQQQFPNGKIQLGELTLSLTFSKAVNGWSFDKAITGTRTRTGLKNLLQAIENGYWE